MTDFGFDTAASATLALASIVGKRELLDDGVCAIDDALLNIPDLELGQHGVGEDRRLESASVMTAFQAVADFDLHLVIGLGDDQEDGPVVGGF